MSRLSGPIEIRELPHDRVLTEELITWQIDFYAPSFPSFDHADWTSFYGDWFDDNRGRLPVVLAGFDEGEFFGSVAIVERDDLTDADQYTPWIAALIVRADRRGQGRGLHLLRAALDRCRSMGIPKVYLWTEDRSAWYLGLGWAIEEERTFGGIPITVMSFDL